LILPFLLLSIGDAPFARTKSQLNIETHVIPAEAPILSAPLPDTMKSASDDYRTAEQFSPVLSQEFYISGSEHSSHKAFLKVENPPVSIKVIGAVGVKNLAQQLYHFHKDNDSKAQDQRNYRNVKHFAQGSCRVI